MISLVFSSTNLTGAQWTRIKDECLVSRTVSFPLLYNLNEIFDSEADLNTLLNTAVGQISEKLSIEGQDIAIVIPESLLIRDIIVADEGASETEITELAEWANKSRFGGLSEKWDYVLQKHPWEQSNYLIHWFPEKFKSILKLTLEERGARPVWMGAGFMTLLPLDASSKTVLAVPENQGYALSMIDEDTFRFGEIFYSSKDGGFAPRATNTGNIASLLEIDDNKVSASFNILGNLSKQRVGQWENYTTNSLDLSEHISFEDPEVDLSSIDPIELQILYGTIVNDNYLQYNNFFKFDPAEVMQPRSEEEQVGDDDWEEKRVKNLTNESKNHPVKENKFNSQYFLSGLIVVIIFLLFFTPLGSYVGIKKTKDSSSAFPWEKYSSNSIVMIKASEAILSDLSLDSLFLFAMDGVTGRVAWTGNEDLEAASADITQNWIIETFRDSILEKNINAGAFVLANKKQAVTIDNIAIPDEFIDILNESVNSVLVKEMTQVRINEIQYIPVIVEVGSISNLLQVYDVVQSTGDNIIIRKIELVEQSDPEDNKRIRVYISIFN